MGMEGWSMPITTLSSWDFTHDASRAKKASNLGPVFITDRGKPTHVLLSIAEYRRLLGQRPGITESIAMPDAASADCGPAGGDAAGLA